MTDAGSLQNLNDIVAPAAVPWWPPAPGWYVVAALLFAALVVVAFRSLRRWQRDRYRREALRLLARVRAQGVEAASRVPDVLKRAALSAYPRDEVAALSGETWYRFLDRSAGTDRFTHSAGALLAQAAYGAAPALSAAKFEALCRHVDFWLRNHVAPGAG